MKKSLFIILVVILVGVVLYLYFYQEGKRISITTGLVAFEEDLKIMTEIPEEQLKPEENIDENIHENNINDTSDFVLAGLELGSTKEMVRETYGEPKYVKKISDFDDACIWFYEGLELTFYGNYLNPITVKSAKYPTTKGIKVGDYRFDIFEKYNSAIQILEHVYYFMNIEGAFDHEGPRAVEFRLIFECQQDEDGNYVVKEITSMTESF